MSSIDEITALEHAFIAATTTDEALAFMDGEGHVRYDYLSPLQMVGPEALRASFDLFFDNCLEAKGRFLSLHVEASDTVGVAFSNMHFTWKDAQGKPAQAAFRITHALRRKKSGADWKIFHSHVSFPMNPETGACDTQLLA